VLKFENNNSVVALTVRMVEAYTNNPQHLPHESPHRFMDIEGPDYSIFKICHLRDITMCVDTKVPSNDRNENVRIFESPVFSKFSLMAKARFSFTGTCTKVEKGTHAHFQSQGLDESDSSKNDSSDDEFDATLRNMFHRGCLKCPRWIESRMRKLQQVGGIMHCVKKRDNMLHLRKVDGHTTMDTFQPSNEECALPLIDSNFMVSSQVTFMAIDIDTLTLSLSYAQICHLQNLKEMFFGDGVKDEAAESASAALQAAKVATAALSTATGESVGGSNLSQFTTATNLANSKPAMVGSGGSKPVFLQGDKSSSKKGWYAWMMGHENDGVLDTLELQMLEEAQKFANTVPRHPAREEPDSFIFAPSDVPLGYVISLEIQTVRINLRCPLDDKEIVEVRYNCFESLFHVWLFMMSTFSSEAIALSYLL
jgi:hypothetical protein